MNNKEKLDTAISLLKMARAWFEESNKQRKAE